MGSITRQMARFVHQLQFDDIPPEALNEAKRFILDSIGCALASAEGDDMQAMQRFVEKLGGPPEATVIATGLRTSAANAAFMNSLMIRALDYNDIYWVQDPSHPSDLLGVVLSAAEANERDGRELLVAAVIAYELEMRWCHAARPGIREIGWHHASLTQFVSPFVAGRLYALDEDQLVAAAGICGSSHFTLGGVVAGHLTNMKNTADPLAVQAGIYAAMMAREGYSGPEMVIEGKEGLFEVLQDVEWDARALLERLGQEFLITQCSYKAFPTEALTHQPISAALSLRDQHDILPEEIEAVTVETTTRGADILSDPSKYKPDTRETADHSLPYVIAVALVHGNRGRSPAGSSCIGIAAEDRGHCESGHRCPVPENQICPRDSSYHGGRGIYGRDRCRERCSTRSVIRPGALRKISRQRRALGHPSSGGSDYRGYHAARGYRGLERLSAVTDTNVTGRLGLFRFPRPVISNWSSYPKMPEGGSPSPPPSPRSRGGTGGGPAG
jgi:2-methylcitrate dehydratase